MAEIVVGVGWFSYTNADVHT